MTYEEWGKEAEKMSEAAADWKARAVGFSDDYVPSAVRMFADWTAERDALQAENKRLKKLIQDIIADGLDEYWMTIPEGKEVLERCRSALSPAEGKEEK